MEEKSQKILFRKTQIEYVETSYFGKLILDYLDQKKELQAFYDGFPSLIEFKRRMELRSSFSLDQRRLLHSVLKDQYQGVRLSQKSSDSLDKLLSDQTFTVVTGHQLCLFTGPLYFLFKIAGIIRQAEELNKAFPEALIVPVFWMATEDHDFKEVNHAHIQNTTVKWETNSGIAVGRLGLNEAQKAIEELSSIIGLGKRQSEIIQLFKQCYRPSNSLAQATRELVNALFGETGLLIIDGDEARLKKSMIPVFRAELESNAAYEAISEQSNLLAKTYSAQALPREINLFYLSPYGRFRLEKKGDRFYALGSDNVFSQQEMLQELESYPERFSPNVLLRPLYQESILPNLAYTGGGGELAYWFQLKALFTRFSVSFPLLVLRNSFLWIDKNSARKRQELNLNLSDLFKSSDAIIEERIRENTSFDFSLSEFEDGLNQIFDGLEELSKQTDKSMQSAVAAQRQKQLNGLNNLKKKLLRAERRKSKILVDRIEGLEMTLFPKGQLQERYANWVDFYLEYGTDFISTLLDSSDFLDFKFSILEEQ